MVANCTFAKDIWQRISIATATPQLQQTATFRSINAWWRSIAPFALANADALQTAIYTIWNIWKERCRRVFENKSLTSTQLVDIIQQDVAAYKMALNTD
ncbi:unnamed protein product [Urochloa decumbens]|uniref:Uncharacterized protein n=1 Tax=Urochloa decumbens TaxID=240449 RepID=A0ABC9DN67_9POAL